MITNKDQRFKNRSMTVGIPSGRRVAIDHDDRLIQISFALFIIPGLLVVLAVGSFGMWCSWSVGWSLVQSVSLSASRESGWIGAAS